MARHTGDIFLSAAAIACNDDAHIVRMLESIADVADEIQVVLDEKSVDRTAELLERFGKTYQGNLVVVRRVWTHSFSQARNAAIERCRGEWVMGMDADEVLAQGSRELVRPYLEQCQADIVTSPLLVNSTYETPSQWHEGFGDFCATNHRNRFFKRSQKPKYIFRVHEQCQVEVDVPVELYAKELLFFHLGDMDTEKSDYYAALLTLDHIDHPESKMQPVYLADLALKDKKQEKAHRLLKKIDPEKFTKREAPLAAQWFFTMGKVGQLTWAKVRAEFEASGQAITHDLLMSHKAIADDAIVCYQEASKRNPLLAEALVSEAVLHIASAGITQVDTACAILLKVVEADSTNVVAAELLELCVEFLKKEQGNAAKDQQVAMENYGVLLNKLGVYLTELQSSQNLARLRADGIDPRVPNGRLKTVTLEELHEMESDGEVSNPQSVVSINEQLRKGQA